jgi:hypothetical protein
VGIPGEPKAFSFMSNQFNLRINFAQIGWLQWVLCAIKDENLAVDTQCGNDVWVLRLVARLVHFARVLNLLDNVTLDGGRISRLAVSANFASLFIVVVRIRRKSFRDLNIGNLQVVRAFV